MSDNTLWPIIDTGVHIGSRLVVALSSVHPHSYVDTPVGGAAS